MEHEIYRGFRIERNTYGQARWHDEWMWAPEDDDGTPYRFERDPYACRDAIDEHLAEQDAIADLAAWNRQQAQTP